MPQKGLELLACCGVLILPAACTELGGLQDRQPFPGFARLAAECVLVPAHILLLPAAVTRANPDLSSPPRSGWGCRDIERHKCGRSCAAVARLPWLPQDGAGSHGQGVCVICSCGCACVEGTGPCKGPPAPSGAAFPPTARPKLVSLWDGAKQFLSLSFLHRHVMNLRHM